MYGILMRIGWRIIVGVAVLAFTSSIIFIVIPYLSVHTSVILTIAVSYLAISYLCIPLVTRTWRYIFPPTHLPQYAVSRDGWPSDPVNVAIIVRDKEHLQKAMQQSGWVEADPATIKNVLREGWAFFMRRPYASAPFSQLYLFGRAHDIGFQIQSGPHPSPRHRHHVRFWRLQSEKYDSQSHETFWQHALNFFRHKGKEIWIGAATHDIAPFAIRMQSLQITHKIDADTEKERDFVINSLKEAKMIRRNMTIPAGNPLTFRGQSFGTVITVDGTIKAIEVR